MITNQHIKVCRHFLPLLKNYVFDKIKHQVYLPVKILFLVEIICHADYLKLASSIMFKVYCSLLVSAYKYKSSL